MKPNTLLIRKPFVFILIAISIVIFPGCGKDQLSKSGAYNPYGQIQPLPQSPGYYPQQVSVPAHILNQINGAYSGTLSREVVDPNSGYDHVIVSQRYHLNLQISSSTVAGAFATDGTVASINFQYTNFYFSLQGAQNGYYSVYQLRSPVLRVQTASTTPTYIQIVMDLKFYNNQTLDLQRSGIYFVDCGYSGGYSCTSQLYSQIWFNSDLSK